MIKSVSPARRLEGEIEIPGDKSISHRALMLGSIADGETSIGNLASSADVASTATCMQELGVKIETDGGSTIVHGRGIAGLLPPEHSLDAGNSGTTMRILSGILVGQAFDSEIAGDDSLQKRPMARIIEPLSKMGARIEAVEQNYSPLKICGRELQGITHKMKIMSGQVKSALILAGLYASGTTKVIEPCATRDHTERMLEHLDANITYENNDILIERSKLKGSALQVPGDISSAAFWLAAGVLVPNSHLLIKNVGINPTRTGFIDVLREMGARIELRNERVHNLEKMADIEVQHSELHGVEISGDQIPRLIDELPLLAVVATRAEGQTRISDAAELRIKETDRIAAISENLLAMSANIESKDDGMTIEKSTSLRGTKLEAFGDHRIAMAGAISALIAEGDSSIDGAEWVNVSYPNFFETLEAIRVD
jgi:3-phosphoshikimate 1-carboxyvinyltransferase